MKQITASGSLLNYIMKGIVFLLLVGSLSQSVIASLRLPVSYISVLGMTAAAYIVLSLYLYNRYTAAVLFPLTIVFLGISIYFFAPAEWRIDAVKWLEWLLDYTLGYPLYKPGIHCPVHG